MSERMSHEPGDRDTLLIVSQVYPPDPAAVGQHIADVAEALVRRGWRVVVYAANRGYDDPTVRYPARETRHGVIVRRVPLSSFGKRSIAVRLLAQTLFMLQAVFRGTFTGRLAAVLASTSPPFAGAGAAVLASIRRVPLYWWVMDVNPDQFVATGRATRKAWIVRFFDALNRFTLSRARKVIVLDRFMAERIELKRPGAKRAGPGAIVVVPPWSHVPAGSDGAAADFRSRHGLDGKFVVMYAGNHAIQHPLETILDAAASMAGEPDVRFVFIGGGAGKPAVDSRVAAGATNMLSLPYQPLDDLDGMLAAADLHVVSMGDDMVGISHPCKIYGAMAVGRPVLYLGPQGSHGGELVTDAQCGWVVAHGDAAAAVTAIEAARRMSNEERAVMGGRGAEMVRRDYAKEAAIDRICDMLEGHDE